MTTQLERMKFNVHSYEKMIDAGVFANIKRVELIEGELVKMPPIGDPHIGSVNRLDRKLNRSVGDEILVSVQNPIIIGDDNEPEPDIALLHFRDDYYSTAKARPEDVLLLIEVSDSTVGYDRDIKVPLYAQNGIPEVWLVNLPKKIVEVYCNPHKGKYRSVKKLGLNETVSPQLIPKLKLKVSEIIG
jgi:Uma2 family endonuclease